MLNLGERRDQVNKASQFSSSLPNRQHNIHTRGKGPRSSPVVWLPQQKLKEARSRARGTRDTTLQPGPWTTPDLCEVSQTEKRLC